MKSYLNFLGYLFFSTCIQLFPFTVNKKHFNPLRAKQESRILRVIRYKYVFCIDRREKYDLELDVAINIGDAEIFFLENKMHFDYPYTIHATGL